MSKVKLMICYGREDNDMREELNMALMSARTIIEVYDDTHLRAGAYHKEEILLNIERSDIIVFLVSSYFFNSDYIFNNEEPAARKCQTKNGSEIIPIYIDHCVFKYSKIEDQNLIPRDDRGNLKPVRDWRPRRTKAWTQIVNKIGEIAEDKITSLKVQDVKNNVFRLLGE